MIVVAWALAVLLDDVWYVLAPDSDLSPRDWSLAGEEVQVSPSQEEDVNSVKPIVDAEGGQIWVISENVDELTVGDTVCLKFDIDLMIGDHRASSRHQIGPKLNWLELESMADARRGARAPRAGLAGDDSGVVKSSGDGRLWMMALPMLVAWWSTMTSRGFVSKRGGLWFVRSDYSALVKHVQKYGGDSVAPSSGWSLGAGRKALQTRTGSSMSYASAAFLVAKRRWSPIKPGIA